MARMISAPDMPNLEAQNVPTFAILPLIDTEITLSNSFGCNDDVRLQELAP